MNDNALLITQLKEHIFELEQHEKDYDELNKKFRAVTEENLALKEERKKYEYAIKTIDSNNNRMISTIKNENEDYRLVLSEKDSKNKSLYMENEELRATINLLQKEIVQLSKKVKEMNENVNKLNEEKKGMNMLIESLIEMKNTQKNQIDKLISDNKKLTLFLQNKEKELKLSTEENRKILSKNDEMNFEMKTKEAKMKTKEESWLYMQKEFDELKQKFLSVEGALHDSLMSNKLISHENEKIKDQLTKYSELFNESDKKNIELNMIIEDNKKEIEALSKDLNSLSLSYKESSSHNNALDIQNDKLQKHIMILTAQNQKLINEIESIMQSDDTMVNILQRKQNIKEIILTNKAQINTSLNTLK